MAEQGAYFLGFDFSTQQIKVIGIDEQLKVVYEDNVGFDKDLPEFGTSGGAHIHDDGVTITAPTTMWIKALDLLLDKMVKAGFDFSRVKALSGDGQQHGSVYWKAGTQDILRNLQPDKDMFQQLKNCFSVTESPIWMDASTSKQCRQLEKDVGGAMRLAELTGSQGFERFTGNQISKLYQTDRQAYDGTERISLVSSFAASLFLGDYAPVDYSDGSGMNLLDIRKKCWSPECLNACGSRLGDKLGEPVASHHVAGHISSYMASRYKFSADCKVVTFTGDNPASLAGLAPREGDATVSLGTSDNVFLWIPEATPGLSGHIFVNPLDPNTYMGLVCFKNSSLTREAIKNRCAGGSWDKFSELLQSTPMGNNGNMGIYFDVTEIQPVVSGTFRFDSQDKPVESAFPDEVEVRAVLESQFMARLMYAKQCGLQIGSNTRVLATGGASANKAILQVISDVFNCSVYVTDVPNSAALGGCYRAKQAWHGLSTPFPEVVKQHPEPVCVATPTPGAQQVYGPMVERYRRLEASIAAHQGTTS